MSRRLDISASRSFPATCENRVPEFPGGRPPRRYPFPAAAPTRTRTPRAVFASSFDGFNAGTRFAAAPAPPGARARRNAAAPRPAERRRSGRPARSRATAARTARAPGRPVLGASARPFGTSPRRRKPRSRLEGRVGRSDAGRKRGLRPEGHVARSARAARVAYAHRRASVFALVARFWRRTPLPPSRQPGRRLPVGWRARNAAAEGEAPSGAAASLVRWRMKREPFRRRSGRPCARAAASCRTCPGPLPFPGAGGECAP